MLFSLLKSAIIKYDNKKLNNTECARISYKQ